MRKKSIIYYFIEDKNLLKLNKKIGKKTIIRLLISFFIRSKTKARFLGNFTLVFII